MQNKTEPATPRRLRRARAEGDVPVSAALIAAAGLGAFTLLLPSAAVAARATFAQLLARATASQPFEPTPSTILTPVLELSAPLVGVIAAAALASGLVQTGASFSPRAFALDLRRLNPLQRSEGSVARGALAGARVLIGAGLVLAATFVVVTDGARALPAALGDAERGLALAAAWCSRLLLVSALGLFALALLDAWRARLRWVARHRMTREEVERERRESEGDPELKRLRRRVYSEWLSGGELGDVARASLVVLGTPRFATALCYEGASGEPPRVLLQAPGARGPALVVAAYGFRVPLWEDAALAQRLAAIKPGDPIPSDCFAAVADALVRAGAVGLRAGSAPSS